MAVRFRSCVTKGLTRERAAVNASVHKGGRAAFQREWGADCCMKPSCKSQRTAESWCVGHILWYTFPWIAKKDGPPGGGFGKGCVVSKEAKENTKFSILDRLEILLSLMNMSYSWGSAGSGVILWVPFGPQQNPGRSPVRRGRSQTGQQWTWSPLVAPQLKLGVAIGPIIHGWEDMVVRGEEKQNLRSYTCPFHFNHDPHPANEEVQANTFIVVRRKL